MTSTSLKGQILGNFAYSRELRPILKTRQESPIIYFSRSSIQAHDLKQDTARSERDAVCAVKGSRGLLKNCISTICLNFLQLYLLSNCLFTMRL